MPDAFITYINLPKTESAIVVVGKKHLQEVQHFGRSRIWLDQYTGEVVRLKNGLKQSLGDKILDSFVPLHFGIFGGLWTRILYVFVGLAPLILFITGIIMYRHRYQSKSSSPNRAIELSNERRT